MSSSSRRLHAYGEHRSGGVISCYVSCPPARLSESHPHFGESAASLTSTESPAVRCCTGRHLVPLPLGDDASDHHHTELPRLHLQLLASTDDVLISDSSDVAKVHACSFDASCLRHMVTPCTHKISRPRTESSKSCTRTLAMATKAATRAACHCSAPALQVWIDPRAECCFHCAITLRMELISLLAAVARVVACIARCDGRGCSW